MWREYVSKFLAYFWPPEEQKKVIHRTEEREKPRVYIDKYSKYDKMNI